MKLNKQLFLVLGFSIQALIHLNNAYGESQGVTPNLGTSWAPSLTFEQRLNNVSSHLVGSPYKSSPLGEAKGIDKDPLIRLDAFDCTTYIETVIALSQSEAPIEYLTKLTQIRYSKGSIEYGNRRHLPEFQWLPELIEDVVLQDITEQVGKNKTAYLHKSMSPDKWSQQQTPIVNHLDATHIPSKTIDLPYLPLDVFLQSYQDIKEVAVLSVVRKNRDDFPIVITHQALLIPSIRGYRVRHARSKPAAKVVDESVETFIARLKRLRTWPVLGLNIADILEEQ